MNDVISILVAMDAPPSNKEEFSIWLGCADALEFLKEQLDDDQFVLYAGFSHVFIHVVLVSNRLLEPPDVDDLMSWNCNASSSWGSGFDLARASAYVDHRKDNNTNSGVGERVG